MTKDFSATEDYLAYHTLLETGELRDKRLYTLTFGCQQNEADTERVRGMLGSLGMIAVSDPSEADVIIVNTCAIREHAEMKALSSLGRFKELKRKDPSLVLGVVGCMAAEPKRQNMLKCDFHYVDFTAEPSRLEALPSLILRALRGEGRGYVLESGMTDLVEGIPVMRASRHKAWVSIMYGCNNFCSYCIVPYVRGRERSRESERILAECRELVSSGVKEITLLGQNVNSYRSDLSFAELLSTIAEIDGDFIIRFMTSHPKDVSDELIEAMAKYRGKIAPYFHLPLQSGSDKILKAMNRTYTRERFIEIAEKLRAAVPGIALSTDVIIGFPGETDEDFLETMDVLERVRFDSVFAFIYSPRAGTKAAAMDAKVERSVCDVRMAALLERQERIANEINLPLVGTEQRVLVDSPSKKGGVQTYTARTDTGKLVHVESECDVVGQFKIVKIERAGAFDLYGKIIK